MISEETPIFIIGTPRSGTTLTAKILGGHPEVFMPGETHFFEDIYSRRDELGDPACSDGAANIAERLYTLYGRYNEPGDQARVDTLYTRESLTTKILDDCSNYEQIMSMFMKEQMSACGKSRWGNNAPRDIFNAKEIADFYPQAKIIVCVRDPRDFLGSYKGKWRATAAEEVERLQQLYHPLITSYLWKASMKHLPRVRSLFPPENVFVLKYEALVMNPEQQTRALCDHVGIDYHAAMVNVSFSNSSAGDDGGRIFTTSVGRWQERISDEEAWFGQKICGRELVGLGYEKDVLNVNRLAIVGYLLSAPGSFVKALNANKEKRGPLIPYLWCRLSSLFARG